MTRSLLRHPQPDQSHDARMRQATQEDQLAEILVLGDEHPVLLECQGEKRFVRGAGVSLTGGENVVPEADQRLVQRP